MKKSITIMGKKVDHVYIIRDIDIDKVTVEKYDVECRSDIENAWMAAGEQATSPDSGDQTWEIILKEKLSNTTLKAKPNVIEMAATMGGKIIKDIVTERTKKGKTVYLSDIILFNVVVRAEPEPV